MTHATRPVPRRMALSVAAMIALLLAGCSSGHIGESWQCPLAEGGICDSVAAADPAVPRAAGGTVPGEPLWLVRDTGRSPARELAPDAIRGPGQAPAPASAAPCEVECEAFDPFGWLMRLFGAEAHEGEAGLDEGSARSSTAPLPPGAGSGAKAASSAAAGTAEPAAAALPATPAAGASDPDADDPHGDDLRTGEVVARIWIAPFVDADGVYREASHVRVVLEPAGWRVP